MSIRHIIPDSVSAEKRCMHLANLRAAAFVVDMNLIATNAAGHGRAFIFYACLKRQLLIRIEAWKAVQF